jgi:hypothetical protein
MAKKTVTPKATKKVKAKTSKPKPEKNVEVEVLDIKIARPILEFIDNEDRYQEYSLEGIVDAVMSRIGAERQDIESTMLELKKYKYVKQEGNNTFELTKKGKDLLQ